MNRKFKIPKTIKAAVLALMLCLGARDAANAQTLALPGSAPHLWYSDANTISGINTAMIAYSSSYIMGSVYYDASSTSIAYVNDPFVGTANVTLNATPTGVPDIAIGNGSSSTDYKVAIAYATSAGAEVDYFDLYDDGSSIYFISASPVYITTYTAAHTTQVVHIDALVDYSATPSPYCSYAFVTWEDVGSGTNYIYADLLNLTVTGTGTLTANLMGTGRTPDVAGIYRTSVIGTPIALLTYIDGLKQTLYYQEWSYGSSPGTVITLNTVSGSNHIFQPRIDANDDYNTNTGSNSNYKVVANVDNSGMYEVRSYDNVLGAGAYWASSGVVSYLPAPCTSSAAYNNFAPVVALGGPVGSATFDGSQYQVAHFTDDGGSPNHDIVFMEPIDYSAPQQLYTGPDFFYWVSENSVSYTSTINKYAVAITTPCNDPSGGNVVTWAYPIPGPSIGSNVEFKQSPYPYGFRQSAPASATPSAGVGAVTVYPNPAQNQLIINTSGTTTISRYDITDMLGRSLLSGGIANNSAAIDVSGIAPGTYILKTYSGDNSLEQKMFVKN